MKLVTGTIVAVAVATLWAARPAAAQNEFDVSNYGARIGFSTGPDQFTIGAYAKLGEIAQNVSLRPSADLGFGDNLFTILGNADLQYSFATGASFTPFVGGGIAIGYYSFDLPEGAVGDSNDTEIGLNLYGGLEFDLGGYRSAFVEGRFGVDVPDFKLTGGIGFY
jgi:hypothetical protein